MAKMVESVETGEIRCPECRGRGYTLTDTYKKCPRCDGKGKIVIKIKRTVIED